MQGTRSEHFVLELVDRLMDETTNTVKIAPTNFNKTEKERIKTGARKLEARRLLISTTRHHYIVNPWFFVPQREDQARILIEWHYWRAVKGI